MAAANLNNLPGIRPLGGPDAVGEYIREHGPAGFEFLIAEVAGVDTAARVAAQLPLHLASMITRLETNALGIGSFLHDAHTLAQQAAVAVGNTAWRSGEGASADGLAESSFLDFLVASLDVPTQRVEELVARNGLSIVSQFWTGKHAGHVQLSYRGLDPVEAHFNPLLDVHLHDSHDYVNVRGRGSLFEGSGDVSRVPGATEALWGDAEVVARRMIEQYTTPGS